MNREILFRGKRMDNGEWAYGSFIPDLLEVFQEKTPEGNWLGDWGFIKPFGKTKEERLMVEVERDSVGQYTGLTDKNGVKIFEGDIIKSHYANAPNSDFTEYVVFHNGRFSATNDNAHWWTMLADGVRHLSQDKSAYMEWCEVIGNIHDNPELLNDGRPKEVLGNVCGSSKAHDPGEDRGSVRDVRPAVLRREAPPAGQ